jgi:RNA polymerase sigma-70 factor (ECF subfamily)
VDGMQPAQPAATRLLVRAAGGDRRAADEFVPLVYDELRRLARSLLGSEALRTLQPTALVHEAYLKLIGQDEVDWQGRTHFFRVAAQQVRRVLIDGVRAREAEKRGGGATTITFGDGAELSSADSPSSIGPVDVLALEEALEELERIGERQYRVVELRFFAGLSIEETARALGFSERTVKEDWTFARAWLDRRLSGEKPR